MTKNSNPFYDKPTKTNQKEGLGTTEEAPEGDTGTEKHRNP